MYALIEYGQQGLRRYLGCGALRRSRCCSGKELDASRRTSGSRACVARLIVAGQTPYPFNNTSGAGPIRLPVKGFSWWGKVSVGHHDTVEIPLNVTRSSANNLDGAIWWPETTAMHIEIPPALPEDCYRRLSFKY